MVSFFFKSFEILQTLTRSPAGIIDYVSLTFFFSVLFCPEIESPLESRNLPLGMHVDGRCNIRMGAHSLHLRARWHLRRPMHFPQHHKSESFWHLWHLYTWWEMWCLFWRFPSRAFAQENCFPNIDYTWKRNPHSCVQLNRARLVRIVGYNIYCNSAKSPREDFSPSPQCLSALTVLSIQILLFLKIKQFKPKWPILNQ